MENSAELSLLEIERELLRFPLSVSEEFQRAKQSLQQTLEAGQVLTWGQEGLAIARQTVRSWEAASEYFGSSTEVSQALPFAYFIEWARCGSALCKDSPTVAAAYFKASPEALKQLKPRFMQGWANLGRNLYQGTWKSGTLCSRFFDASPALLQHITFQELQRFTDLVGALSRRSYDLAGECLLLGQEVFPLMGPDKDAFISVAASLVETSWRDVKSFFEAVVKSLASVEDAQRLRFLNLAERLARSGGSNIPTFILESAHSLSQLEPYTHSYVLSLSETLLGLFPAAMPEFVKSCPSVLGRISISQLELWFNEGIRILRENDDGGVAYFKVESARSEEVLEALSSGLELGRVREIMRMYCRALAGSDIQIATTQELVSKNIGWVAKERPTTEGSTVYLPPLVDKYANKADNFSWFKVVSTHQVAHLEFGSFGFVFETPSVLFKDLRPKLASGELAASTEETPQVLGETAERGWLTDMQRFFDLFQDRKLALDIFTVIEDGRLDARVKLEYPGIRNAYQRIQRDTLADRPQMEELPMREAMVEFLVRLSLQQYKGLPAPDLYVEEARTIARVAKRVLSPLATVEDSAEATIRIYAVISQIPNEELPPENWEPLDVEQDEEYLDPEDMEQLLQQMGRPMQMKLTEAEEQPYESPREVEYRGDFKPELTQLLSKLKMQQQERRAQASEPISKEMLEELLRNSAELEFQTVQGDIQNTSGLFANNILKEAGITTPQMPEFGQGPLVHMDEEGGSLETTEPLSFLYDEWDFRADDYKPRWCIVREKNMAEGDLNFYAETLKNYATLVSQIKRQFEQVVPEMFRKIRRLPDGEEYDLDALIEAFVDARTGNSPSDKLYWRRNKVQRDVAVVFLLDMSASTAEAIDESKRVADDWDAPDDPVEYMIWLRTRRGEGMRRTYKRIIDLEKESTVLLINALESIGDIYGIYGFSGYGRENVEFYTIKDIHETFSDKIKRRIDRIAPLHATRMGPAIRHATTKLDSVDAKTKILFLISDGRPQDRGYSREGVEKEYAVHDTKAALTEARRKEIVPFALTVDKAGHDYLKTMCQDMGYEVLADIQALPKRLPLLYRRLTI